MYLYLPLPSYGSFKEKLMRYIVIYSVIDKAIHLESINEAAFYGLEKLQRMYVPYRMFSCDS